MSAIQKIYENTLRYPERVRQAKDKLRYTNGQIAELSGVSPFVVSKLMAGNGSEPKLYDAAAICLVLGLSLDELFELKRPPDDPNELLKRIHDLELANKDLSGELHVAQETSRNLSSRMRDQRAVIYILICACIVLAFALAGYLFVDLRVEDAGLIQWGRASALAWLMILLILAALAVIAWTVAHVARK